MNKILLKSDGGLSRKDRGQETRESENKPALEGVKTTDLEVFPEEIEAVATHQEDPNEEAAVETVGARVDRSGGKRSAVGSRSPRKRRTKDDVRGTPKVLKFRKRRRAQPKMQQYIRNRGLKKHLRL
jgi:hypothetical protein